MVDYLDKNLISEGETLAEGNIYPEEYIQEPDNEEEHLMVKPFEPNSQTTESCVPVKEEIVSAISSRRNDGKLRLPEMKMSDENLKLVYQSNQSSHGEP